MSTFVMVYLVAATFSFFYEGPRTVTCFSVFGFLATTIGVIFFGYFPLILYASAVSLGVAVLFAMLYGNTDFDHITIRGPYKVGNKDYFLKKSKHAATVYYPMNKNVPITNKKYWIRFRDEERFISGLQTARSWYLALKVKLPSWMLYSWREVRMDVQVDGLLAPEFRAGKPLVPIVFSHGLIGSSTMYSVLARELAS